MNRPSNVPQPGGVYASDLANPPQPPAGAVASTIVDTNGRIIAYCWVVKEHAGPEMTEACWAWFDRMGVVSHASGPSLKILR